MNVYSVFIRGMNDNLKERFLVYIADGLKRPWKINNTV